MEMVAGAQKLIAAANANELRTERPDAVIAIGGERQRSRCDN
jgi:hypothetical protein